MKPTSTLKLAALLLLGVPVLVPGQTNPPPAPASMQTAWAKQVKAGKVLPEYPRPQMTRKSWGNLNGKWDYAIAPTNAAAPATFAGQILVPFPIESGLSGVQKRVTAGDALWYQRTFSVGKLKSDQRVLLHFGAADWATTVMVNGQEVGRHQGGYAAFSFDVTPFLKGGREVLTVRVWDPTNDGDQPRGKQVKNPRGIYYTPVSGLWQTVWYEVVSATHVQSYQIATDIDAGTVTVVPAIEGAVTGDTLKVKVSFQKKPVTALEIPLADAKVQATTRVTLRVPAAKLWSPDSPNLYDLQLTIVRQGKTVDEVGGYFGMRKIEVAKDARGTLRMLLNHQPVFQYGPLDQGFWPDGIYTAPTDAALLSDVKAMKAMGFNMVRKHVKVEPDRWYYYCDQQGLIVWQDMPSGFGEIVPVRDHNHSIEGSWLAEHYPDVQRSAASEQQFRAELSEMVRQLQTHHSICVWVPFNESWGQFKTDEILSWVKQLDPTRLVDGPSGWIDRGSGEMHDYHLYDARLDQSFPLETNRALVIGEFGGLGYPVQGHLYSTKSWSYKGSKTPEELAAAYGQLIGRVQQLRDRGFSAAVYTQLTDVETEINGLLTYDRAVFKLPAATLKQIHAQLYTPLP